MESNITQPNKNRYYKYYRPLEPLISKTQNRIYTAAILSFFAISLFGWYAIRPTLNTIIVLRKEIEEKKEINQKMEKKISQLIEAQSNYQQIENQIYLLDQAIPPDPQVLDLGKQIERMISETEATASSITLTNNVPLLTFESENSKKATKDNPEFNMNAEIQGDYPQLELVLTKLNNMRRIVTVLGFGIGEPKKINREMIQESWLNIALRIKSYYQK